MSPSTEAYFVAQGIATTRGTYCRLSFLRDALRGGMMWSPEMLVEVKR